MKLRNLLWLDFTLGFSTGIIGLTASHFFERFLQLPHDKIILISVVTLLYSLMAFYLARRKMLAFGLVRSLIIGNWLWSGVSLLLLWYYFPAASVAGKIYLVLQVVAVGGLAFFEGKALREAVGEERLKVKA